MWNVARKGETSDIRIEVWVPDIIYLAFLYFYAGLMLIFNFKLKFPIYSNFEGLM